MASEVEDRLVSLIPIHYTNALRPNIQLHQFPLLTRPLEVPPSAVASGKCIRARLKSRVKRLEVHVPVDTRPEVWNSERSKELGAARGEDDKEKNQELPKVKQREGEEARLSEVRMRSEQVPQVGVYVLGVLREGRLHLHRISESHQFRPTLTYMDMHLRKSRRTRGGDEDDEDDGPPPDPDEPLPAQAPKKEKKPARDAKEVQVAVRKTAESQGLHFTGGMTQIRREMLTLIHAEEDEDWDDYEYCGGETMEANEAFDWTSSTFCRGSTVPAHHHPLHPMSASSDTESECEGSVSGWNSTEFMEMPAPVEPSRDTLLQNVSHLHNALDTLSSITICAIKDDERALQQVWIAFGTIQRSLDRVISFVPSNESGRADVQEALRLLLNPSFLNLLFEYRAAIYNVAARNADGRTLIVSWADLILAKLGQAVIAASGSLRGVASPLQDHPITILAQRDDDMLRAAAHLPECWSNVAGVLCSEHHSPAAVRLATSLIFGVDVMLPRLAGDMLSFDHKWGHDLLKVLDKRIKRIVAHDVLSAQMSVEGANEHDRIAFAMFVSLYAVSASAASATLDFRPQSCATLVAMIQAVLSLESNPTPFSIISPPAVTDKALMIMVKWGVTIPWSWTRWMDGRLHNSDVIEHLSVAWLHAVDLPPDATVWPMDADSQDYDLTVSLASRPLPALSMMTRLLLHAFRVASDMNPDFPSFVCGDLAVKLCWSVKYLLRIAEVDGPSLLVIYGLMCKLFALLPDDEAELDAKDSILEALSLFPSSLKVAANVFSDPKAECCGRLNEKLVTSSRLLLDNVTYSSARVIRQTTQFLALMWMAGTPPYFNLDAIQRFLSYLCDAIGSGTHGWRTFGDAAVGLLSVVEKRSGDPIFQRMDYEDQLIWVHTSGADPTDLLLASSLAAYVCATAGSRSNHLLWADAWSYFCDVLLLILGKEFSEAGSAEPLGLFVAPGICRALLSLVEIATDHTLRYGLSSPWTKCLMTQLRKIRLLGEGGENHILSRRISPAAELLYNHLEHRSNSSKVCGQVESQSLRGSLMASIS